MKIIELIQIDFSEGLTLAIMHSLWQSLIIMFIITGISKLRIFKFSENKYLIHVLALFVIFVLFLINIIISISNPDALSEFGISGTEFVLANFNQYITENSSLRITIHEIIAISWVVGVILFFSKFLIGNLYLMRVRMNGLVMEDKFTHLIHHLSLKLGITEKVRLLLSKRISIPLIIGFLKPTILMPASYFMHLTPVQLESIIIHELVHIRRQDYLVNQLQSLIECIMFFNPFVWILSRQIRKYREFYCDDMVLSQVEDKKDYLKALYEVAKLSGMTDHTSVALFNNKSELIMRVKRMLNQKTEKQTYKPFLSLFIIFAISIGMTAFKSANTVGYDLDFKQKVEEFVNKTVELPFPETNEKEDNDEVSMEDIFEKNRTEINKAQNLRPNKLLRKIPLLEKSNSIVRSPLDQAFEIQELKKDTVPNEKKIRELEKQLEEKSKEMEELGAKFEQEISHNMALEMEKIEKLSRQLEEQYEAKSEEWSKNNEQVELQQKMEELVLQLEDQIEKQMPKIEDLNSEEIQAFEETIEKLAQEMEEYVDKDGKVTDEEKMAVLNNQIKKESKAFREAMSTYQARHKEMLENDEIQKLQNEIQTLAQEFSNRNFNMNHEMGSITKELQAEIQALQEQMQSNLLPLKEGLQQEMHEKAMELDKIAKELEKERRKRKEE